MKKKLFESTIILQTFFYSNNSKWWFKEYIDRLECVFLLDFRKALEDALNNLSLHVLPKDFLAVSKQ